MGEHAPAVLVINTASNPIVSVGKFNVTGKLYSHTPPKKAPDLFAVLYKRDAATGKPQVRSVNLNKGNGEWTVRFKKQGSVVNYVVMVYTGTVEKPANFATWSFTVTG